MNDDDLKKIGDRLEAATQEADTYLRKHVQPYLVGSPERIFGMAVALQRLGVEVVMRMRPDGHTAWEEAIGALDAMKKEIEDMRDSNYPEPARAFELPLRDVENPSAKV